MPKTQETSCKVFNNFTTSENEDYWESSKHIFIPLFEGLGFSSPSMILIGFVTIENSKYFLRMVYLLYTGFDFLGRVSGSYISLNKQAPQISTTTSLKVALFPKILQVCLHFLKKSHEQRIMAFRTSCLQCGQLLYLLVALCFIAPDLSRVCFLWNHLVFTVPLS